MTKKLTKEDVPFLVEHFEGKGAAAELARGPSEDDKVTGDMSIPNPVEVNVQGTMSKQDYEKCSMIMAVCTNMVQQTITNAALEAGIEISVALTKMDAWVAGFTTFPFPFFTFKDQQDDTYSKTDFSLSADPDVVEAIVNIKGVPDLKDAVVGALRANQGELIKYSNENRDFNYFGVITAYNETEIATRVIKFAMHMANTDVQVLCVGTQSTQLNTSYDTYQFVGDKYMMIKMQEALQDKLIDQMAERLLEFIDDFYAQQLENYRGRVKDVLTGVLK